MINFREADIKGLAKFMIELKEDTPFFLRHREDVIDVSDTEHGYFLCDGDNIVGYGFFDVEQDRNTAIVGWALLKDYRGRGLSKVMADKIFKEAKAFGVTNIRATVARNNWRAIVSDLSVGFKVIDEDPDVESDKLLYIQKNI